MSIIAKLFKSRAFLGMACLFSLALFFELTTTGCDFGPDPEDVEDTIPIPVDDSLAVLNLMDVNGVSRKHFDRVTGGAVYGSVSHLDFSMLNLTSFVFDTSINKMSNLIQITLTDNKIQELSINGNICTKKKK